MESGSETSGSLEMELVVLKETIRNLQLSQLEVTVHRAWEELFCGENKWRVPGCWHLIMKGEERGCKPGEHACV